MRAKVKGSYAFGILRQDTNELIGTRKESPLIVGIGKDGFYIASDVIAVLEYTREVIYLENHQLIHFKDGKYTIYDEKKVEKKEEVKAEEKAEKKEEVKTEKKLELVKLKKKWKQ